MSVEFESDYRSEALQALKQVLDPEIGLNIVDLGLIYDIQLHPESKVMELTMSLTTPFCPMGEAITDAAKQVLHEAFPGFEIRQHVVFDPPWTQDRISESGMQFLNR